MEINFKKLATNFLWQPKYLLGEASPLAIMVLIYRNLSSIVSTFKIKNDAEIFPMHYTWKIAEKGFKMAFIMNKLANCND